MQLLHIFFIFFTLLLPFTSAHGVWCGDSDVKSSRYDDIAEPVNNDNTINKYGTFDELFTLLIQTRTSTPLQSLNTDVGIGSEEIVSTPLNEEVYLESTTSLLFMPVVRS